MPTNMLSPNFSLSEMLVSQTATRLGFDEQFNPPDHVIKNLRLLCVHVLQPLRDYLGYPLKVNSGYRCRIVNTHIGGAINSQHISGHAADIIDTYNGNGQLLRTIFHLGVPYDQVIDEFGLAWIHISYNHNSNRYHKLKAVKDNIGRAKYINLV